MLWEDNGLVCPIPTSPLPGTAELLLKQHGMNWNNFDNQPYNFKVQIFKLNKYVGITFSCIKHMLGAGQRQQPTFSLSLFGLL